MSARDRVRWDEVYRQRNHLPYPTPDPLLFEYTPPADSETARALDLAAGLGQNGLWLAAQGYTVDIMEISRIALARARQEMAAHNLRNVNLLQIDLDEVELEADSYDVVCVFRYLRRDLFARLKQSVRPGGRIIYETFNQRYLEVVAGFNPAFLLEPGELLDCFADWQILHSSEDSHISQLVARKPA